MSNSSRPTTEIVKGEKDQMAILKHPQHLNIPASLSRVQLDKRNICGKLWSTEKPLVVQGE